MKYLAFIFAAVGTVIGAVIIELFPEQYLPEVRCQSHFSGSLPLLIFSYWIFLYILEIREYRYEKNLKNINVHIFESRKSKKIINILASASGLLLLLLLLYVVTHTLPAFLLKIERVAFVQTYQMPWIISKIRSYSYFLLVFPCLALIYANRLIAVISVLSYLTFNFWVGEKFGAFFTMICIFLIVLYNKIVSINPKEIKRIILITAVVIFTLIVGAVIIFSYTDSINPYKYFVQRTAQQGQLWWKTYDLYKDTIHPSEFANEISAFLEGDKPVQESVGAENGIYKVMYLCAPKSVVSWRLEGGSRYTQADYAVVYYYFGTLGVIIYSILMGLVVSGVVNSFIFSMQKTEYIKAMIYLRFFYLIRVVFSMFTFGVFSDFVSILSCVYLIFTHRRRLQLKVHENIKIQAGHGEKNA